jgi:hypothetical protein
VIEGIFSVGVIRQVLDACYTCDLLDKHGLDAIQHRHSTHRATVATATHREKRCSFGVMTNEGHEPTVSSQRWVHFGRDHRLDFSRQLVVANQTFDRGSGWLIRIANHQARRVREVKRCAGQGFYVFGRDDDLQSVVRTYLIGKRRLGGDIEREVVTELLAGVADNFQP